MWLPNMDRHIHREHVHVHTQVHRSSVSRPHIPFSTPEWCCSVVKISHSGLIKRQDSWAWRMLRRKGDTEDTERSIGNVGMRNPSIWEAEAGGSLWVQGQPGLQELVPGQAPKLHRETLLKNNNNYKKRLRVKMFKMTVSICYGNSEK